MLALRETTKWASPTMPNHTYLLDGTKLVAYIKQDETTPIYFSKPMNFDKRGREFEHLRKSPFATKPSNLILVTGSRGDKYEIDPAARTCTCPGFVFKGHCKHLKSF